MNATKLYAMYTNMLDDCKEGVVSYYVLKPNMLHNNTFCRTVSKDDTHPLLRLGYCLTYQRRRLYKVRLQQVTINTRKSRTKEQERRK